MNFNSPYQSTSMIDFWRNWNISLSRFLKDYLYVPLGGNRCGGIRRYLNLMLTMLLGGLWHGANWTFVVWGGLHGTFLMINHGIRRIVPAFWQQQIIYRLFAWSLTFIGVVTAWVFFRANSFAEAWAIVHSMFFWHALPEQSRIARYDVFILVMAYAIALIFPNVHQCFSRIKLTLDGDNIRAQTRNLFSGGNVVIDKLSQALLWKPSLIWAIVLSGLFVMTAMLLNHPTAFIYFDF